MSELSHHAKDDGSIRTLIDSYNSCLHCHVNVNDYKYGTHDIENLVKTSCSSNCNFHCSSSSSCDNMIDISLSDINNDSASNDMFVSSDIDIHHNKSYVIQNDDLDFTLNETGLQNCSLHGSGDSSNNDNVINECNIPCFNATECVSFCDVHQAKDVSHSRNNLFVLYFNARSIKNKLDEFHARVYLDKPDIIAITESWLDDSFNAGEVFPSEYIVFRNDRNTHGGGVALGIKCNLNPVLRSEFLSNDLEIVCAEFNTVKGKCLFGVYYRPPSQNKNSLEILDENLCKIQASNRSYELCSLQW